MDTSPKPSFAITARRHILVGLFTLIPIWLTLLLMGVILGGIHQLASPMIGWFTSGISSSSAIYQVVKNPWFETSFALMGMLALLYVTGWLASRWIGRTFLALFDNLINRVPIAKTIYKTIKRLADAVQVNQSDFERVVLIEFPSPNMKTVGLVTRTFKDSRTGREVAAVYVPTTPNPTSGYLEIVPVENLVPTNWKLDEAMSFIISGGADVPSQFYYDRPPADPASAAKKDG